MNPSLNRARRRGREASYSAGPGVLPLLNGVVPVARRGVVGGRADRLGVVGGTSKFEPDDDDPEGPRAERAAAARRVSCFGWAAARLARARRVAMGSEKDADDEEVDVVEGRLRREEGPGPELEEEERTWEEEV